MKNIKEKTLEEIVYEEKVKGFSDYEIGRKYGVSFKFIERVMRKYVGVAVSSVKKDFKIKKMQPKNFKLERTTLWSFKNRGNWATHSNEYRGNWSPYIPRNIILKYCSPGDLVLDTFCGGGTTAIEAKLLGRKCIALDINEKAIEIAKRNVSFNINEIFHLYEPEIKKGDARNLSFLQDNSVDLICTHPPYANIIHYTENEDGDLSFLDIQDFLKEMDKVAKEFLRVLKPGRKCVFLIGDMRKNGYIIPLGFKLIDLFLKNGFILKHLIIKRQHNCRTTGFWYEKSIKYNFLLLSHEYLPILEKPEKTSIVSPLKETLSFYPSQIEKFNYEKKVSFLESTTIWIFPEKEFELRLNKNIIARYAGGGSYTVYSFVSPEKIVKVYQKKGKNNLIFFKIPEFLKKNYLPHSTILSYLEHINEKIKQEIGDLKNKGYLVIQTKDVREKQNLVSVGKEIISLNLDCLKLKEIIILASQKEIDFEQTEEEYKIVHQYLFVFEKIDK